MLRITLSQAKDPDKPTPRKNHGIGYQMISLNVPAFDTAKASTFKKLFDREGVQYMLNSLDVSPFHNYLTNICALFVVGAGSGGRTRR